MQLRGSSVRLDARAASAMLCICLLAPRSLAQAPIVPPGAAPPAPGGPSPPGAPAAGARPPLSDTLTGPARTEYEAAKLLYVDGDFAGALIKFRAAHELSKDARLLWNMVACEKNLRHYASALELLRRYQAEGAASMNEADKTEASELAAAIRNFVSTVSIAVDQPGAAVYLDDRLVGTTPLPRPLLVDMGPRRLRIVKDGFRPYEQTGQVAGASDIPVQITLEREVHEGRVAITAGAHDVIAIDGRVIAEGRWEGVIPSGGHMVRVTAAGKRAYQSELVLRDRETRNVLVTLEDEAKPAGSGTWLWVAGGAVLVAGVVVGGYFLLKPKDETRAPIEGSIPPGTVQTSFGWTAR